MTERIIFISIIIFLVIIIAGLLIKMWDSNDIIKNNKDFNRRHGIDDQFFS